MKSKVKYFLILSIIILSSCSRNINESEYGSSELVNVLYGKWICHPTTYQCEKYNLDPSVLITIEIKEKDLVMENIPINDCVENHLKRILINEECSWNLQERDPGNGRLYWVLHVNSQSIGFTVNIKERRKKIYLDFIEDPEYSSGFIFNKVESNP